MLRADVTASSPDLQEGALIGWRWHKCNRISTYFSAHSSPPPHFLPLLSHFDKVAEPAAPRAPCCWALLLAVNHRELNQMWRCCRVSVGSVSGQRETMKNRSPPVRCRRNTTCLPAGNRPAARVREARRSQAGVIVGNPAKINYSLAAIGWRGGGVLNGNCPLLCASCQTELADV